MRAPLVLRADGRLGPAPSDGDGLTGHQVDTARRWEALVLRVTHEEMAHRDVKNLRDI